MSTSAWLNIIGLSFDILGVILIFFFGLPTWVKTRTIDGGDVDAPEVSSWQPGLNWLGLGAMLIGFGFQIAGNVCSGICG